MIRPPSGGERSLPTPGMYCSGVVFPFVLCFVPTCFLAVNAVSGFYGLFLAPR